MRNKLFMRITALLLAVVFVFLLPVRVYALSGVIDGIAGGLGLTMGELAGLILAGAGVVVGSLTLQEYGDDLQRALNQAMQAEQAKFYTDPAMQAQVAEEMEVWKARAQAGYIELESGVTWIVSSVKAWAQGFIQGNPLVVSAPAECTFFGYTTHSSDSPFAMAVLTSESFYYLCIFSTQPCIITHSGNGNVMTTKLTSASGSPYQGIYFWGSSGGISDWEKVKSLYAGSVYLGNFESTTLSAYNSYNSSNGFARYVIANHLSDLTFTNYYAPGATIDSDVYPESVIGGIADQISLGVTMDVIGLPDIAVPGADVLPVNPSEGQTEAAAITDYLLAALLAGTITWEQYWELVGVYSPGLGTGLPTISIPNTETGVGSDRFEITDEGVSSVPVTPPLVSDFSLDLRDFFPFCIPFDIYDMLNAFDADPVAPYFELELSFGVLGSYPVVIDLSAWNEAAEICRLFEFVVFCICLAAGTKKLLAW